MTGADAHREDLINSMIITAAVSIDMYRIRKTHQVRLH
ncbi:hypothetical protein EaACW_2197 [Erwinia amylovora ACW56400]|uniref:Uncharacterized protein n=1 Tax=Erwinia amylovora NBRC 12687 = CFBP 1232 TaxID=1219359 RepID=A0A830ZWS9_ERWAM|nr:hypothetical protein EaACW_2197 [Erwinia amylovora ACW56400]CCO79042.1 hypothetical protein BN432_2251 [Erwinia amylovora Ea356]CCO82846.1 hypothetical protein BN433_2282 [Erwinia amylovora Ea266]CCO86619.1 hypothetical protein BN434_2238 [Erwinia amylovora CFBP 2585]CCO90408.1 hypothetical protein BN435_2244 [Erwinia amylovora 01SFR-BO]CCO94176.1 hypothetical protein BN437_2253 [Erwinia amylovora NBRC 12687 = CFBP 1232]CCO99521.1 hypothetical protein BN438_2245 [Erwinia amylovora UPN527]